MSDFFSPLRPLYVILRALGLAPFSYNPENSSQKFHTSPLLTAYSALVCLATPIVIFTSIIIKTTLLHIPSSVKGLLTVAEAVNQFFMYATYIIFVITLMLSRKKIVCVLNNVVKLDLTLFKEPNNVYRRTRKYVLYWQLFVFLTLGAYFCTDFLVRSMKVGYKNAFFIVLSNMVIILVYSCNLEFMCMIIVLKQRLAYINSEIRDMGNEIKRSEKIEEEFEGENGGDSSRSCVRLKVKVTEQGCQKGRLRELRKAHFKIFKMASVLDEVNGIPLLISLVSTLLNIVVNTHVFLLYGVQLYSQADHSLLLTAIVKLLWALEFAFLAFQLTFVCHKTKQEYTRTAVLIQDILFYDDTGNKSYLDEFERFLSQVSNMKLGFSAFGFFDIDFRVLSGIAGAVTTYLIVLMQMY